MTAKSDLDGRELRALRKLAKGQDRLLMLYRLGTNRSPGKALDDIAAARDELEAIDKARKQQKEARGPFVPTHRLFVLNIRRDTYEVCRPSADGPAYTQQEWEAGATAAWSFHMGDWRLCGEPQSVYVEEMRPDDESPNVDVVAIGVRGDPRVPRDVRQSLGQLLTAARMPKAPAGPDYLVAVPMNALEHLSHAMAVDFEVQDVDGLWRLIPLPLYHTDDGVELTEEQADAYEKAREPGSA